MEKKVAIVGAGVGGLATACRLAHKGYAVDVFEKLLRCGGRAHVIEDSGFLFDTGPSFVLMPDFFEEVFASCGRPMDAYLDMLRLEVSYKIFYADSTTLSVYRDEEAKKEELERIEAGGRDGYERFIKETQRIYGVVRPLLYRSFTPRDMFNPKWARLVGALKLFRSYWGLAGEYFRSEKLRYAFTFEAMFIGVSPFHTPAFYSIISFADHFQKIFHPRGGMYQIPRALERLAREKGVRFSYEAPVSSIYKRCGRLCLMAKGAEQDYDAVVSNADYAYTRKTLLRRRLPRYTYSCSVFLVYLGLRSRLKGLCHHNLFFARDVAANLSEIFEQSAIPRDPSFYVHVPTVTDDTLAPKGKEIVYILVPVPNRQGRGRDFPEEEFERIRATVLRRLSRVTGTDIEPLIEVEHRFYPADFTGRYNIENAATFGLAHTLMQSAFFRPANRDARWKDLYYVGASTQPGGGLPPVIAGSRIVADLIAG